MNISQHDKYDGRIVLHDNTVLLVKEQRDVTIEYLWMHLRRCTFIVARECESVYNCGDYFRVRAVEITELPDDCLDAEKVKEQVKKRQQKQLEFEFEDICEEDLLAAVERHEQQLQETVDHVMTGSTVEQVVIAETVDQTRIESKEDAEIDEDFFTSINWTQGVENCESPSKWLGRIGEYGIV